MKGLGHITSGRLEDGIYFMVFEPALKHAKA